MYTFPIILRSNTYISFQLDFPELEEKSLCDFFLAPQITPKASGLIDDHNPQTPRDPWRPTRWAPQKTVRNGVTVDGRDPAITIWDVEKLWDEIDKLTDFSYQQYKYNSILRVK